MIPCAYAPASSCVQPRVRLNERFRSSKAEQTQAATNAAAPRGKIYLGWGVSQPTAPPKGKGKQAQKGDGKGLRPRQGNAQGNALGNAPAQSHPQAQGTGIAQGNADGNPQGASVVTRAAAAKAKAKVGRAPGVDAHLRC